MIGEWGRVESDPISIRWMDLGAADDPDRARGGDTVRNHEVRRALLIVAAGAALSLAGCATKPETLEVEVTPVAEADRKSWDAEEMTRLTGELATAIRDVRAAWRREPAFRDSSNPNQRSALRLDQSLRDLDQRTRQLHTRVQGGAGHDETLNIVRNIRVLLNDIDVEGRRVMTSQWMDDRVRPAMVLINEIAAYYGSDALFDPETMQRIDRPGRTQ